MIQQKEKKNGHSYLYTIIGIMVSVLAFIINLIFDFSDYYLFGLMLLMGVVATGILDFKNKETHAPTVWTSLGLLFTFISLLFAFKNLPEGSGSTIDLKAILPIVSSAFTTSVVGIFISIGYNIINKVYEHEEEVALNTPEENLYGININMSNLVDLTTKSIENNDKVLNKINETFEELSNNIASSVNSGVVKVMNQLSENVEGAVSDLSNTLKSNVSGYTSDLQTTMSDQLGDFQTSMSQLSTSINTVMEQHTQTSKDLMDKQLENSNNMISSFASDMSIIKQEVESFFKSNIDELNRAITVIINMSHENQEEKKVLISQFESLIHEFSDSKEAQIAMLDKISEVSARNLEVLEQDTDNIQILNELSQQMMESNNELVTKVDKVLGILEDDAA